MRALAPSLLAALLACGSETSAPAPPAEPLSDGRYQMGTVLQITLHGADSALLEEQWRARFVERGFA